MRWAEAIFAVLAHLKADADLVAFLGGPHVYRATTERNATRRAVEYTVIANVRREQFERVPVQFDCRAESYTAALAIEDRLRTLLDHNLPVTIGGVWMFSEATAARDVGEGRAIDFLFQPVRDL